MIRLLMMKHIAKPAHVDGFAAQAANIEMPGLAGGRAIDAAAESDHIMGH